MAANEKEKTIQLVKIGRKAGEPNLKNLISVREQFIASRKVARNFPYLIAPCDDGGSADNHGGSGEFEVQPKISVIRPKNLRYKITDTLPLTLLQSLANPYMTTIMRNSTALGCPRIFCDTDLASGQFALEREACLRSELFRGNGQLDQFFIALCLVSLYKVLNLHRRDGNSFPNGRRALTVDEIRQPSHSSASVQSMSLFRFC